MDDILLGMGKSCVNYCIHGIVRGLHKFRTCNCNYVAVQTNLLFE